MAGYRDAIYQSYRATRYEHANPDDPATQASRTAIYRYEFRGQLPSDKKAKILDLGCGSGLLVEFLLADRYTNVIGIDVSEDQVAHARTKGLPVQQAEALSFLEENAGFDVIILTDVIEHLKKDEIIRLLHGIRRGLADNGYALIRTGNAASVYGLTTRYIDFTHEIGFTEESFRQVLLATGFRDISITDNKAPFGWAPKRFLRWTLLKVWRVMFRAIYMLEVGTDSPRLLGKALIAIARK
jgi:SAM-dependent methyltransferase